MKSIFKDIKWYEWKYIISNKWDVYSLNYNWHKWLKRILIPYLDRRWYYYINLHINKKQKKWYIHRLVAINFIENTNNKPCVNHIDWNKTNNNINNLEWCTYSENLYHRFNILKKWNKKFWDSLLSKKINQYSLDWSFIKTRGSISEILFFLNKKWWWHISSVCSWARKSAYWYKREYYNKI